MPEQIANWYTAPVDHISSNDDGHSQVCYSQEGEDMLLYELLGHLDIGFYVDIGAHHPKRYSNTHFFYKKGWRGINADAMPESMKEFNIHRPNDINVEVGLASKQENLIFYVFNEAGLNTFDQVRAKEISQLPDYFIVKEVLVRTITFAHLMAEYLPDGVDIDFLSIDIEGLDYEVLKSNDWNKYRPRIILVEHYLVDFIEVLRCDIYLFLTNNGYNLTAKTYRNLIFTRK